MKYLRQVVSCVLMLGAGAALAQKSEPDYALAAKMERQEAFYEGTVGDRPTGFRFIIDNQRTEKVTYYVGPDWQERSLTLVEQRPGKLILRASDGAIFNLDFFYDEKTAAADFWDSIGLRGILSDAAGRMPVKIYGHWSRSFDIGGRLYSVTGAASDEAFESNIRGFVRAVLADRPAEAARHTSFPLRSDFCRRQIRNASELRRNWRWLFPKDFKADMAKAVLHNLSIDSHSDEAFLLRGSIYFDKDGATVVRPPKCPPRPGRKSVRR